MNYSTCWIIISALGIVIFIVAVWLSDLYYERNIRMLEAKCSESKRIVDVLSDYNTLLEAYSYEWFMDQMQQVDNSYKIYSFTGNKLLDSIISYKKQQAETAGIDVKVECLSAESSFFWPMSETDTVALVFNLMDNSIEAAEKCRGSFIHMVFESKEGVKLIIENSKPDNVDIDDFLSTTKDNRREHGFGVGVINELAVKYGGHAGFEDKCDIFAVTIELPYRIL